jgi:hypothetical protein
VLEEFFMAWRDAIQHLGGHWMILPSNLMSALQATVDSMTMHIADDTSMLSPAARVGSYSALLEFLGAIITHGGIGDAFHLAAENTAVKTISALLSAEIDYVSPDYHTHDKHSLLLRRAVAAWYKIASARVSIRRPWADYLSGHASISFDMLSTSQNTRQARVLFASFIVQQNTISFTMDRYTFYSIWLQALVAPEHLLCFEHVLSTAIYAYDSGDRPLGGIMGEFVSPNGLSLIGLKIDRRRILRRLIQRFFTLWRYPTTSDDSQISVEEELNSEQISKLLEVMTDTMKAQWKMLRDTEQEHYTAFVHTTMQEIASTFSGLWSVDSWFYNNESGFPSVHEKFSDFFVEAKAGAGLLAPLRSFQSSLMAAIILEEVIEWEFEMAEALSCNHPGANILSEDGRLLINPSQQVRFLRLVCPLFMEKGSQDDRAEGVASIVARVLKKVICDASLRLEEANDGLEFAKMCVWVLCHLTDFVADDRSWGDGFLLTCADLGVACYKRFRCLEPYYENMEKLAELARTAGEILLAALRRDLVGPPRLDARWTRDCDESWERMVRYDLEKMDIPAQAVTWRSALSWGMEKREELIVEWTEALDDTMWFTWLADDLFL